MNWKSINFDWNQVRAFLATVEEGSLSAGARALGQTQPTLGRQVAALEEALGVVLFERVGRSLVLTAAGADLVEHVRAMGDAAHAISLAATSQSQEVAGEVRITSTSIMAAFVLPQIVERLSVIAPRLDVELVATDELTDLQRREADIAIRHVRPNEPELIAKLVQEPTGTLYAAKSYLDRVGRPETEDDLQRISYITFDDKPRMIEMLTRLGLPLREENFRYGSRDSIVGWQLVRRGLGASFMSDYVAQMDPEIEKVLPSMEPISFPIWLVAHRQLHTSPRFRVVFDVLAEFYGGLED